MAGGIFLPGRFQGAHQTVTTEAHAWECVGWVGGHWRQRGQAGSIDPSELHLHHRGLSFMSAGPGRKDKFLFN